MKKGLYQHACYQILFDLMEVGKNYGSNKKNTLKKTSKVFIDVLLKYKELSVMMALFYLVRLV